jgi:hypothetical protein
VGLPTPREQADTSPMNALGLHSLNCRGMSGMKKVKVGMTDLDDKVYHGNLHHFD